MYSFGQLFFIVYCHVTVYVVCVLLFYYCSVFTYISYFKYYIILHTPLFVILYGGANILPIFVLRRGKCSPTLLFERGKCPPTLFQGGVNVRPFFSGRGICPTPRFREGKYPEGKCPTLVSAIELHIIKRITEEIEIRKK